MQACVKCECPVVASPTGRITSKCPGCGAPWTSSNAHTVTRPNPAPFTLIDESAWRLVVYWDEEDERPRIGLETSTTSDLLGCKSWRREDTTRLQDDVHARFAKLFHFTQEMGRARGIPVWAHPLWKPAPADDES